MSHRPIYQIAAEIRRNWTHPYFGAVPYLRAMHDLDQVSDMYGADSGRGVVLYFLSNSSSWRGEVARRVKAELRQIAKL